MKRRKKYPSRPQVGLSPRLIKKALVLVVALASLLIYKMAPVKGYDDIAVVKVYDGDTIKLANGDKVRLIGIDCPEMHESDKLYADSRRTGQDIATIQAMGRKAGDFAQQLAMGRRVRLEFDLQRRDKYGRLLAYVYLWPASRDEQFDPAIMEYRELTDKEGKAVKFVFLNATMMKAGFANPMSIAPNAMHAEEFQQLYRAAREQRRGLWQGK